MPQQTIDMFNSLYDFEYEVITNWNPTKLSQQYLELLATGLKQGFHPVFVVWDDLLVEQIDVELGEPDHDDDVLLRQEMADLTRRLLISAKEYVQLDQFFTDRSKELGVPELNLAAEFDLDEKQELELLDYLADLNEKAASAGETDSGNLLLVKIPTTHPEEVFAHFPLGGINLCPPNAELVALASRWHQEYGAVPAVISSDTVEFYIPNPPATIAAAAELAKQHFLVCPDLTWQICDDLENLTSNLLNNVQWFFWWD